MPLEVVPFQDGHLEAASVMLSARYRAELELEPLLPMQFEDPAAIVPLLKGHTGQGPGVAASRDGRLAGFLLSRILSNRGERLAWVPDSGHSVAPTGGKDTYREMYAHLSSRWVKSGCFSHAVSALAHDALAVEAWFSLGFGLSEMDAIRDLEPVAGLVADVEIRRAERDDMDVVVSLSLGLRRHVASAPTFIPLVLEGKQERRRLEEWHADPAKVTWLAYRDGEVVGCLSTEPSGREAFVMPRADKGIMSIVRAYVEPNVRGQDVGKALLNEALEWARAEGYDRCVVDFESANIPGAHFWLGTGFRPVVRSLRRRVDERIAWANEHRDDADLW